MASQHQATKVEKETESLHYWNNATNEEAAESAVSSLQFQSDKVSISHQQSQSALVQSSQPLSRNKEIKEFDPEEDLQHGWKIGLLRRLVENLTGKELKIFKASDFRPDGEEVVITDPSEYAPGQEKQAADEMAGWGVEYHYQHSVYESEQTSFSAQGIVNTADGRQINLNVQLNMSREFASYEGIDIRAGDALKDPLVINYAGTAAQLEATDLQFDIDLDGSPDQMKFVTEGSGFLALDKNGDGQINDGSELFGPTSGDGFAELAAYDSDGNNWIDENDEIFDRLQIWERSAEGEFSLLALGQRGVGAIYLDRVESEFSLNDEQNTQLGQVRTTGLFLQESGLAGTVQQLDLIV